MHCVRGLCFVVDYRNFPDDKQTLSIRVESFGLNSRFVIPNFTNVDVKIGQLTPPGPVNFITNGNVLNFEQNPTWMYLNSYRMAVQLPDYGISTTASSFPQPVK